jgi:hypothetical protein
MASSSISRAIFAKLAIGVNRHQLVTRHPGVIFFSAAYLAAASLTIEAITESSLPDGILGSCVQESNDRHRRLLRARPEWPHDRAAEQRKELASS